MNVTALEQDGFRFASSAVECDQKGFTNEAIFFYKEAAQALTHAANAGSQLDCISKANEYYKRVEELIKHTVTQREIATATNCEQIGKRAKFMLVDALEEDEAGNIDEAISLYLEAADLCLKSMNESGITSKLKKQLENFAKQSLDRAEHLKTEKQLAALSQLDKLPTLNSSTTTTKISNTNVSSASSKTSLNNKSSTSLPPPPPTSGPTPSNERYTKEEIEVLRFTSLINGREYLPFMSVDLRERFAFPVPFSDKNGLLELAQKQKARLGGWKRPDDFMVDPKMIIAVSSLSIKQTVVSDCSFVASLAISAAYERRFRKKLITSIIYPQNRKGEPVYNPCGKYMVRLHINGIFRKVIIDDRLPVDTSGKLLCSYSANENELWVSLVEKAYMKVMGGYDFPGSNSNIDLHALTGWIPERQSLRDSDVDYTKFFEKLRDRFHKGHCLATISTGPLRDAEADRAGLVPTHAYAVLDVQYVLGIRFLQLKNPWSHLRWKGNYSAQDEKNWTPALKQALKYDNKFAQQYDNGVFWIDWDSARHFYDTVYLSWDPDLFPRTICCHASWLAKDGPKKDSISLGNNPQYRLEVRNKQASTVWVLLTRHITEKDDFAENKEFITLLVYKNEGRKVYHTYSPPPFMDGVRINSPHYLAKIQVEDGGQKYTLVVSQYEKNKNIRYSLRIYSLAEFKFSKIADPFKLKKRVQGEWTASNAGGCANNRSTYNINPVYQINIQGSGGEKCQLLVELRAPLKYSIGFDIVCVETNSEKPFDKTNSGSYRSGYTMLELSLPSGVYNIIPSTFSPQQLGIFFLDIGCSVQSTKISHLR